MHSSMNTLHTSMKHKFRLGCKICGIGSKHSDISKYGMRIAQLNEDWKNEWNLTNAAFIKGFMLVLKCVVT